MLLKNGLKAVWHQIQACVHLSRLQRQHPSCRFYPGVYVDAGSVLGKYNVIFENTSLVDSVINDHSFVQKNSRIFRADIGKFCSIASKVSIGPGSHPTDMVSSHPAFYSATQPLARTFAAADEYVPFKRVTIGNDVWIGESALIMDGVKIGDGAVIGAGAVVTADVAPYAIVGGVPAKLIRYRFDEETRRGLLALCWWDKPEGWLKEHQSLFTDPKKLLSLSGK